MAGTLTVDTLKSDSSTPTVFRNTSGTEIGQLTRAWINFNGTSGSTAARASFNVSSVTRNNTGDYTVTMSNALADGNFSVVTIGNRSVSADYGWYMTAPYAQAPTSTTVRMTCTNSAATFTDYAYVNAIINR